MLGVAATARCNNGRIQWPLRCFLSDRYGARLRTGEARDLPDADCDDDFDDHSYGYTFGRRTV
jgi:hypothetical protein